MSTHRNWRLREDRADIEKWLRQHGGAAPSLASRSINGLLHRGDVETVLDVVALLDSGQPWGDGTYWLGPRSEAVWRQALGLPPRPGEARCPTCGHKVRPTLVQGEP